MPILPQNQYNTVGKERRATDVPFSVRPRHAFLRDQRSKNVCRVSFAEIRGKTLKLQVAERQKRPSLNRTAFFV